MEHSTWEQTLGFQKDPQLGKYKGLGGKVKPGEDVLAPCVSWRKNADHLVSWGG